MRGVKAVVQRVVPKGPHGPYVIATSDQLDGSVTFSLEPTVWKEPNYPEGGTVVYLSKLSKKRAGWRAKEGRLFRLSDEQIAGGGGREFLYPTSRQFPFDEVCERIVRELERRNFQVPGIEVEFHEYGSGEQKLRCLSQITTADYKVRYGRKQRTLPGGRWGDHSAVTEVVIPKMELHVYDDESGPTLYIYVGDDYESDREAFMNHLKVNSRLSKDPRTYLKYRGGWKLPDESGVAYTHRGSRAPYLVHDDDLAREYSPQGDEPTYFDTGEVFEKFDFYLETVVLAEILAWPLPKEQVDVFVAPEPIPFPEGIGPLFCFGDYRDESRIRIGQKDPDKLELADRYGMTGSGYRLLSLDVRDDETVPKIAWDGFLWCGVGEVGVDTDVESFDTPHEARSVLSDHMLFRVTPKSATDIYVIDQAEYEKRRLEIWDSVEDDRDTLTNEEVADFMRARARTIVPIAEYEGGYEEPLVLVHRELALCEVEIVKDVSGRQTMS